MSWVGQSRLPLICGVSLDKQLDLLASVLAFIYKSSHMHFAIWTTFPSSSACFASTGSYLPLSIEDNLWLMASPASSLLTEVPGVYMSPARHPKPLFSDRLIYWYGSQATLPSEWLHSEGVMSSRTSYAIAWTVIEISTLSLCLPFLFFFSHFLTCFSREYLKTTCT